jgi:hypothetical protein
MDREDRLRRLALVQGVYFTATGIWPLLHMGSFERLTGPKTDKWLVRTVGVLVASIGGTLLASSRRRLPPETIGLAIASAAALACIDGRYASAGRISPIYLADAAAEAALVGAWASTV